MLSGPSSRSQHERTPVGVTGLQHRGEEVMSPGLLAGLILIGFVLGFVLGNWTGQWIADSEWQSKGEPNATHMNSGGKFYRVTRVP